MLVPLARPDLLSMPLVDIFQVPEYHSIPTLSEIIWHWNVGLLLLLALPHVGDVGVDLLQVGDVHLLAL